MPNIENLKAILILFGIPFSATLLAILLALWLYPSFRLLIGDILKFFGFAGRWARRASIECEMEGTINSFAKGFNSDLTIPLLPQCSVHWVKENTPETVLEPGRAIVRVSFGADRNVNLFNATKAFVKASLLPRVKPFLRRPTVDAVDLLVTRNLLRDSRREALTVFNTEFMSCPEECREQFHRLTETDDAGLFKRILLQEFYFFAETLGDKAPQPTHGDETDAFVTWLYDLAIREREEQSKLAFEGRHIRVGVVLVAQTKTFTNFGMAPYVRRAKSYATKGFHCVYLLARGARKNTVERIVGELCSDGCFESLTKHPTVLVRGATDEQIAVTCYCLRPVPLAVIQKAWEMCSSACSMKTEISATIEEVLADGVYVDVCGLRAFVANDQLSEIGISNGRKYFKRYDELSVRVLECDINADRLTISNRGTTTDPKRLLDTLNLSPEQTVCAVINKILTKDDGYEVGLIVSLPKSKFDGFVPRYEATRSRFAQLYDSYQVNQNIEVAISCFDPTYANFICSIPGLPDPWSGISLKVGSIVAGPVRLIKGSVVICEPEPGLEAWCFYDELAWGQDQQKQDVLKGLSFGDKIEGVITYIDTVRRRVIISRRRINLCPGETFLREHHDDVLSAKVISVQFDGAKLQLEGTDVSAFLPRREMEWTYCVDPSIFISEGDKVKVRLIDYNSYFESFTVSRKRVIKNQFAEFQSLHKIGETVIGSVRAVLADRVLFAVRFESGCQVMAYIYKSEASNIAFVNGEMLSKMFVVGDEYRATVKAFYPLFENVELTRKDILRLSVTSVEYGKEYDVMVVDRMRNGFFVYSDDLEGFLDDTKNDPGHGRIRVIPARIEASGQQAIEFHVVRNET